MQSGISADSELTSPSDSHHGGTSTLSRGMERLWLGFMTARVSLSVVLLLLETVLRQFGQAHDSGLLVLCSAYFVLTLIGRVGLSPQRLNTSLDLGWLLTLGADFVVFSALQLWQGNNINYTPLLALPVLMASVLGSLRLALGTAASASLLLLSYAAWQALSGAGDALVQGVQFGLMGAGSFVIALLVHQLAARVAREEERARRNQLAAHIQSQVNDLVIESLSDGVLVVDGVGTVHAANPAARQMLQAVEQPLGPLPFDLHRDASWRPLAELNAQAFAGAGARQSPITLRHQGEGARYLRARTQLTATYGDDSQNLCVIFLQDQREMETRMRVEKLASMGRMSAAVAHEIRNPLAAIAQANGLLDEDLTEARHRQLTQIVQQNARRLERIVDDVLNLARVRNQAQLFELQPLALNETVARICQDWMAQTPHTQALKLALGSGRIAVTFESDHLQRVLVNLLDNARRYASDQVDAIQVTTNPSGPGQAVLSVWSDGPPMEPTVAQHMFEPFFSSESRSSGLGLYISRELCEGYGAVIAHRRQRRVANGSERDGNEFFVSMRAWLGPVAAKPQPPLRSNP